MQILKVSQKSPSPTLTHINSLLVRLLLKSPSPTPTYAKSPSPTHAKSLLVLL